MGAVGLLLNHFPRREPPVMGGHAPFAAHSHNIDRSDVLSPRMLWKAAKRMFLVSGGRRLCGRYEVDCAKNAVPAHSGGGDADRLASDHRGLPGSRGRAQHALHFGNAGLPRGKAGAGSAAGRLARRGSRDAGAALQAPALLHLPARPAHRPLWPGAGQLPPAAARSASAPSTCT